MINVATLILFSTGSETLRPELFVLWLQSIMENDACVEPKTGDAAVDQVKEQPAATTPYRYTKVITTSNLLIMKR